MNITPIYLSRYDHHRLRAILTAAAGEPSLRDLHVELDRAIVVPGHARVPTSVVTMDSHVTFEDQATGEIGAAILTLPEHGDPERGEVSVVDALGTALLGCSVGDVITFIGHDGARTLKLVRVLQSPLAVAAATLATP